MKPPESLPSISCAQVWHKETIPASLLHFTAVIEHAATEALPGRSAGSRAKRPKASIGGVPNKGQFSHHRFSADYAAPRRDVQRKFCIGSIEMARTAARNGCGE